MQLTTLVALCLSEALTSFTNAKPDDGHCAECVGISEVRGLVDQRRSQQPDAHVHAYERAVGIGNDWRATKTLSDPSLCNDESEHGDDRDA